MTRTRSQSAHTHAHTGWHSWKTRWMHGWMSIRLIAGIYHERGIVVTQSSRCFHAPSNKGSVPLGSSGMFLPSRRAFLSWWLEKPVFTEKCLPLSQMKTHEPGLPWNHSRLLSPPTHWCRKWSIFPCPARYCGAAPLFSILESWPFKSNFAFSLNVQTLSSLLNLKREITVQYVRGLHHDSAPFIKADVEIFPLFFFKTAPRVERGETPSLWLWWITRWRMCWSL